MFAVFEEAALSFLEPLFLIGLLAGAVPIIVHLINRRKAVRRPFPALKLLQKSNQKIARSIKIRQWVLLALRVLAVAFLAVALAKPYVLSSSGITAEERMPTAVVFVVETGATMTYGDWWPRAQRTLNEQLGKLRPWDEVALVSTTDSDALMPRLSTEHGEARKMLAQVSPSHRPGALDNGLKIAADILASSQLPNQRIVVISDFSQGTLAEGVRPDSTVPYAIERVSVRGRDGDAVKNLAVVGVEYEQEGTSQERTWKIEAAIRNLSDQDVKRAQLNLRIGDVIVATELVDVPAGKSVTSTFRHRIDATGTQKCAVELVDVDRFALDNTWYFTIQPREQVRALLVNGEPSSVAQNDELFFLMRALSPGRGIESPVQPTVTTVDGLDNRNLANFDVVVLANVARLSQSSISNLTDFVEGGGGLFIGLGSQVDPAVYNQQLGGLLPRPLRGLKLLAERDDPDAPVKTTRFGNVRRQHPIFRVFSLPGGTSVQSVQAFSYMLLDPSPTDEQSSVLLSFQDNAPALLERPVGQGRVMLLTTSLDLDWTDFPIRTAYLPLMHRSMMYLARRSASRGATRRVAGSAVRLEVAGLAQERVIVHTPSAAGKEQGRLILEPTDGEVVFVPERVGYYDVWADNDEKSASRNHLEQLMFAVNLDPRSSDLRMLPDSALDAWTSGGAGVQTADGLVASGGNAPPAGQRRVNLWSRFLFLITLILLAETILGTRRSVLARLVRFGRWQRS